MQQVTDGPTKRQLFSSKKAMAFVQDRAPAHTSKVDQTWCQKNLPNFYTHGGLAANLPDLNIIDKTTYKDPAPETLH